MVVSDSKRYVYIAIPKTGSQAVCHWLCCNYAGKHKFNYHEAHVPDEYSDYTVWTVVREPSERCFSWWWMGCREPDRKESNEMWGWTFEKFMHHNIERKFDARRRDDADKPNFSMTQKRFVDVSKADYFIHYERLKEELEELPFIDTLVWPIPIRNPSTKLNVSFHEYFENDRLAEGIVWAYCSEDVEAFGYERKILTSQ